MEPRELVLRELRDSPWLQQRELAARLSEETGLAESTLIRLFQRMETEGELVSGLDGRRTTYALPEPEPEAEAASGPEPTPGALWSDRLQPLGEPAPEPEQEPEPDPQTVVQEPEPEPAPPPPPPDYTRPAWPFAAVVAVVLAVAVLAALLLTPDKRDPLTGAEQKQEETRPAGR